MGFYLHGIYLSSAGSKCDDLAVEPIDAVLGRHLQQESLKKRKLEEKWSSEACWVSSLSFAMSTSDKFNKKNDGIIQPTNHKMSQPTSQANPDLEVLGSSQASSAKAAPKATPKARENK